MGEKQLNKAVSRNIIIWLVIQNIVIIVAAVLSLIIIGFVADNMGAHEDHKLAYAFGIIIPMCVLLSGLNYYLSRIMFHHVTTLSDAMERAANGDFNIVLATQNNTTYAKVYQEIYKNFNTMCKELRNVQVLRNDFVNNYSHEFKTPITSINGFAELLLKMEVTEEERRKYLQIIMDESARLADLANSTILLSRLDSQQIITGKQMYSLDEQLRECAIILSPIWSSKDIFLSVELQEVSYHGNAEMMQHLWLNLLSNAIKFTPAHGNIGISLATQNDEIIIEISDAGAGMSEEDVTRIFEKYYQAPSADVSQGLGLGLAIVKRITDLCGGKISVYSKLNEGSTFTIILPNT